MVGTDTGNRLALAEVVEAKEPSTSLFLFRHSPEYAPWVVLIPPRFFLSPGPHRLLKN